jgi:signal transduction histidine kinase
VGNALKFTPAGEVVAALHLTDDGSPLAIEVRDTGVGIAADRLQAIFEPFEQGDNGPARRFEGTGLGLAICRQLCDLLGYRLTVTSEPGRGSVFRVGFAPQA